MSNKVIGLSNLKRYDEAVVQYDRAIDLNSKFKDAYINKVTCLMYMQKTEEALDTIKKSIKKYPKDAEGYVIKAFDFSTLKRYDEAFFYHTQSMDYSEKV